MATPKSVEAFSHEAATRRNIRTAEHQPVLAPELLQPVLVAYERCNRDLGLHLTWRGEGVQHRSDLVRGR